MEKQYWISLVIFMGFSLALLKGCRESLPEQTMDETICDDDICEVNFDVQTWEDQNLGGKRDETEPPLPHIQVSLEYPPAMFVMSDPETKLTDEDGFAQLTILVKCPCGVNASLEDPLIAKLSPYVAATIPPNCKLTTPDKLSQEPFQFGFLCSG